MIRQHAIEQYPRSYSEHVFTEITDASN